MPENSPDLLSRHKNPDGSVGGLVSAFAKIDPTATIKPFGKVLKGACVGPHQVVLDGQIVSTEMGIIGPPPASG